MMSSSRSELSKLSVCDGQTDRIKVGRPTVGIKGFVILQQLDLIHKQDNNHCSLMPINVNENEYSPRFKLPGRPLVVGCKSIKSLWQSSKLFLTV